MKKTFDSSIEHLHRAREFPDKLNAPDINGVRRYPAGSAIAEAALGQQKLCEVVVAFYDKVVEIRGNTKLTSIGHAEAIKEEGSKALLAIDRIAKVTQERLTVKLGKLNEALRPAGEEDKTRDAAWTLREIECRNALLNLSPMDRAQAFITAVNDADELVFDAVVHAPVFLQLVVPAGVAEGKRAWMERRNPEVCVELTDTSDAKDIFNQNVLNVRQIAGQLGGNLGDDDRLLKADLVNAANEAARKASDVGVGGYKGGA